MTSNQKISATIVADSINTFGQRITTMILVYPRSVHSETMTHRMFTRNAASSRAIPYLKLRDGVVEDTFYPINYQRQHSGMQGSEYLSKEEAINADEIIRQMRTRVISFCDELNILGVTKQVINRYLEPYQYYQVLVTATEWDNFIGLRSHPDAEIHIAELSDKVLEALNTSQPKELQPGDWHLPFGDTFDLEILRKDALDLKLTVEELKIAVAIARCARVSYNNFNGSKNEYKKDYALFKKLFINQPIHASPSEHVAYAMSYMEYITNVRGELQVTASKDLKTLTYNLEDNMDSLGWCRNFRGWIQYRTMLDNDTIWSDPRLKKHGEKSTSN